MTLSMEEFVEKIFSIEKSDSDGVSRCYVDGFQVECSTFSVSNVYTLMYELKNTVSAKDLLNKGKYTVVNKPQPQGQNSESSETVYPSDRADEQSVKPTEKSEEAIASPSSVEGTVPSGDSNPTSVVYNPTMNSNGSTSPTSPVHQHSFTNHEGKPATCIEGGYEAYKTCSCGYSDYKEIPALGHQHTLVDHKDAGCEEKGYNKYQCSRCGDAYSEELAATGHELTEASCKAPSICKKCGKTFGDALPHEMRYGVCNKCGYRNFSEYAISSNQIVTDSWYHLENGDGDHYLNNGEASIRIDQNGNCTLSFASYSFTFQLGQGFISEYGFLTFYCYSNGARLGTEYHKYTRVDFRQVRGENVLCFDGGGAWGFSAVIINFKR